MKFRFSLGAVVALALLPFLAIASDAAAQAPKNISMTVGVCDPAYGLRCAKPDASGNLPVTGSVTITPSGTQDTNLKQVNGATVNVGSGAAGTGTQRVILSTDSPLPSTASTSANQTAAQAPTAPATATATKSILAGCTYTSAGVTFTNGQQGSLSCGSKGGLSVSGTSATAATDDGSNPLKMGAMFNNSLPSYTTGQRTEIQTDARGGLYVRMLGVGGNNIATPTTAGFGTSGGVALGVEESGRTFSNITTNATTAVKSGVGNLHAVCINTKGATANTATIYDNTAGSGTKIATIDTTAQIGCITYDVAFGTGLTIVTATGTAADITVSYR